MRLLVAAIAAFALFVGVQIARAPQRADVPRYGATSDADSVATAAAMDIVTLGAQFDGNPRKPQLMAALAAVAGATMADVVTARELSTQKEGARPPVRDYSMRSGFPMGTDAARGAAAKDFRTPDTYRATLPQPGSIH